MRLVVEPDGQLDEDMGWKLDVLGIATVAVEADIAAGVHAQRLEIGEAPAAMAAVEVIVGGHAVAHCEAGHAAADVDDLARDLVTDYARKLRLPPPGLDVLDGQPRSAGDDAGDGLAGTGNRIRQLDQLERRARRSQQHCFHGVCPVGKTNLDHGP